MSNFNEYNNNEIELSKDIKPYFRQAKYYETDQMGIIHHSNYIRWFEEARIDFLSQIGLNYDRLESLGILSPVLGISCEYKASVKFNDEVLIYPTICFFNGIKMTIEYKILDAKTNQLKTTGESKHCFVTKDFKPLNMKKNHKEIYDTLVHWTCK